MKICTQYSQFCHSFVILSCQSSVSRYIDASSHDSEYHNNDNYRMYNCNVKCCTNITDLYNLTYPAVVSILRI